MKLAPQRAFLENDISHQVSKLPYQPQAATSVNQP